MFDVSVRSLARAASHVGGAHTPVILSFVPEVNEVWMRAIGETFAADAVLPVAGHGDRHEFHVVIDGERLRDLLAWGGPTATVTPIMREGSVIGLHISIGDRFRANLAAILEYQGDAQWDEFFEPKVDGLNTTAVNGQVLVKALADAVAFRDRAIIGRHTGLSNVFFCAGANELVISAGSYLGAVRSTLRVSDDLDSACVGIDQSVAKAIATMCGGGNAELRIGVGEDVVVITSADSGALLRIIATGEKMFDLSPAFDGVADPAGLFDWGQIAPIAATGGDYDAVFDLENGRVIQTEVGDTEDNALIVVEVPPIKGVSRFRLSAACVRRAAKVGLQTTVGCRDQVDRVICTRLGVDFVVMPKVVLAAAAPPHPDPDNLMPDEIDDDNG